MIRLLKSINRLRLQLQKKGRKVLLYISPLWSATVLWDQRFRFRALRMGLIDNRNLDGDYFNLRRNIHRLEKGLSYSAVKEVFGRDYIVSTIESLIRLQSADTLHGETEIWCISVLDQFFRAVNIKDPVMGGAYDLYKNVKRLDRTYDSYPYRLAERAECDVTLAQFRDLSLKRRSVRYFKPIAVSPDKIGKIFSIAKLAPSACNRQSFRYFFYNDKPTVDALAAVPGGVSGYELYNIVVIVGEYNGYFSERDVNAPVVDSSLAAMAFLFACECDGLSTVCINWPNLPDREKKIRKIVHLRRSEFVVMMIGLGYPSTDGKIPYSKKRENETFLLVNQRIK